jgi:hypothetical protein
VKFVAAIALLLFPVAKADELPEGKGREVVEGSAEGAAGLPC